MKKTILRVLAVVLTASTISISAPVAPEAQVVGHGVRADGYSLTIAARSDEDGADGTATLVDGETKSRVKIDITSIVIKETDRHAILTGVVTSATGDYASVLPGTEVNFSVIDDGEGKEAIDQFQRPSGFGIKTEKPVPIIKGNFQVRGDA